MEKTIVTPRLILRPATAAELRRLRQDATDPEYVQVYGDMLAAMDRWPGREEWCVDWRIRLRDGAEIGGAGFKAPPEAGMPPCAPGEVEIGYEIDLPWRGKGYATEAVGALTQWALRRTGVVGVIAQAHPDNCASHRVLMKNGFIHDGDAPEGWLFRWMGR